ncbi:hypothetical protein [Vibrio sonorensis]|uniref:hypothetical protein n=1 Tax=Vibrio sonorensis TaxID=1004316 RepID=UPI0008D9D870|nr:hypothetical protein [Vibrio sonorensis]
MIHAKNRKTYHVFNFDNFNESGLKSFILLLKKTGSEVSGVTATNRVIKKDGEKTKKATLFFLNGQRAELQIGEKGDVITAKVNGRAAPVKSDTDKLLAKSLHNIFVRGQTAFDKSLAKKLTKIDTDKPNKTPASRTQAARVAELDELIAKAKADLEIAEKKLNSLTSENDSLRGDINQLRDVIAKLKSEIKDLTSQLDKQGVAA